MWQRDVPWSSVKQLRTVLETEYSVDDIFDAMVDIFGSMKLSNKLQKDAQAKSEKAKEAYGFHQYAFLVTDQNTGTTLLYRAVPLPW